MAKVRKTVKRSKRALQDKGSVSMTMGIWPSKKFQKLELNMTFHAEYEGDMEEAARELREKAEKSFRENLAVQMGVTADLLTRGMAAVETAADSGR